MDSRPLKILMVNKFYRPFGGPETCLYETKRLLENKGHSVIVFSMSHPDNWESPQSRYFTEQIDFTDDKKYRLIDNLRLAFKLIYSFEAKRKISALINDEKPDIAHLHGIYHQLSPSIITPLHRAGIPTLMTLHDYKLICLSYKLLVKGSICEACKRQQFWRAIPAKCVKNSYTKTTVNYIEHLIHKALRLYEKIDLLIPPSEFSRKEHIKMGINPERLQTIENFINLESYEPSYKHDGYVLFFGRLVEEKGVATLIRAMSRCPDIPLKIAGNGPDEGRLRHLKEELNAKNVHFIGFKTGKALSDLIRNCAFALVPSEWYENCSMTVLEAFAYGKPVIGAGNGGIPEQVISGSNGYLHPPGDAGILAGQIASLFNDNALIQKMGQEARKTVETKYSAGRHYERLIDVYKRLLSEKSGAQKRVNVQ